MEFKLVLGSGSEFEYLDPSYLEKMEDAWREVKGNGSGSAEHFEDIGEGIVETEEYVQDLRSDLVPRDMKIPRDNLADTFADMGVSLREIHEEFDDELYETALNSFGASLVAASYNTRNYSSLEDPVERAFTVEGEVYETFPEIMKKIGIPYDRDSVPI